MSKNKKIFILSIWFILIITDLGEEDNNTLYPLWAKLTIWYNMLILQQI